MAIIKSIFIKKLDMLFFPENSTKIELNLIEENLSKELKEKGIRRVTGEPIKYFIQNDFLYLSVIVNEGEGIPPKASFI